jgi:hypothetical protein
MYHMLKICSMQKIQKSDILLKVGVKNGQKFLAEFPLGIIFNFEGVANEIVL